MMLSHGVALKGCATRPGKPASALDRDAVAKQVAVIPFMPEWASAAEFRLNRPPSCEDVSSFCTWFGKSLHWRYGLLR